MLLYTILVASLVLLFALGITNTAYKEAVLSSSARDAGYSFFAADSGAECGLYLAVGTGISCLGCNKDQNGIISCTDFNIVDTGGKQYCVIVTHDPILNRIESRGYNVDCNNINSPRSVERAIRVTY